jgi:hypothetical protein
MSNGCEGASIIQLRFLLGCNEVQARQGASPRIPRMKNLSVCFLLIFMSPVHASTLEPGSFRSTYAVHDVELGTDSQAAFWRGASSVYAEVDNRGLIVPGYRTQVRSRWTKSNLYLLFVCPYEELSLKPSPNVKDETYGLWNWDVAELFIGSDFHNIRRYKEFELSPFGEWIDLDVNLDLPDHTVGWTWNSGFQVAARIDSKAKIWYGAMKIPFGAIDPRPAVVGRTFRVNLFRCQGPPGHRKSIAWKAPMSETFHVPERFGRLVLAKGHLE